MNTSDSLSLLGRATGGLLVVIVLIGLVARIVKRTRGQNGATGLRVVDRLGLSREANLTVVEVADRLLLLGVTAQGVTMLADLDEPAARPAPAPVAVGETELDPYETDDEIDDFDDDYYAPESLVETFGERPQPVPAQIPLDDYPDLASALRAAGRTARAPEAPALPAVSTETPRTRSQARAEARAAGPAPTQAQAPVQAQTPAPTQSPAARSRRRVAGPDPDAVKVTTGGGAEAPRRAPVPVQASGSVLSPHTWKQGIDALRDLTVRRG